MLLKEVFNCVSIPLTVLGITMLLALIMLILDDSPNVVGSGVGSWLDLNTTSKQIEVGNNENESAILFSIGLEDNFVYYNEVEDFKLWKSLEGQSKQIAVGNDIAGRLTVFSIGAGDGNIYYKKQLHNGSWSRNWTSLEGQSKQIAVGNDITGGLGIFMIAQNNKTYFKFERLNDQFSEIWTDMMEQSSVIDAVQQADNTSTVFVIDITDNMPYYQKQAPGKISSNNWVNLGGQVKNLAVGKGVDGRLIALAIGKNDDTIYYKAQLTPNGRWNTNWTSLEGQSKQVTVGNDANGRLLIFSLGTDDHPYVIRHLKD